MLYSLKRVGIGFGLAALIGIPMGFIVGRFTMMNRVASPLINLLRPVSPLAWLPIGLYVFEAADPSAIWVIFICSIWPMILNTAEGGVDDYIIANIAITDSNIIADSIVFKTEKAIKIESTKIHKIFFYISIFIPI